ncbi:amino acid adenylation domain-containing protein [Gloeocapsopsis sp. IPPAS B-1203]|uniref:amino acid adenylation domain-containing protein n=1 Tax=Gloeocapsopsis sp. IPPAS B-1203 TaxID=2049454 RepID=UPI000C1A42DD|nr:amino acid adenylation domain-containing protein [Gloeocapsopsis sp. IPPAS B-1203]PIG93070.1 amino acid adenylation protein [Gloeocapsopsis sp. IPPAS B-1203]
MSNNSFSNQGVLIHELVEIQVAKTPDAIAVIFQDQQLTYRELNEKANQLAHYLKSLGVKPDVLVGVCVERSIEMIIALLGILKSGGAYVPLDPAYPKDRLAFTIEDTQIPILLTQQKLARSLPLHQGHSLYIDADWEKIAQQSENNPFSGVESHNLAYVIYTSGSTGKPKGVAIEHRNTVAFIDWAQEWFSAKQLQGVLASTSLCFDLSIFELFVTLSCGGTVILAQNALQLPDLPAAQKVTLINTVPSAIATLLRMKGIPASVETINLAGEPLQNSLVQQLYQLDHVHQVCNLYGPSEDTTYSTVALMQKGATETPSIGRPISNTQICLLDSQLKPVSDGMEGEIYIAGAGLARGYLNRPDLTDEKFIPNPFSNEPGSRLYKTGDLAIRLPDGNLKYLGRIDHQVKIRGFRIELGEIESVLVKHPKVSQIVVVAREVSTNDKRLVAYVVPNSTSEPIRQNLMIRDLRDFLKLELPDFMIPAAFVFLEELPLTLNGKIDRRALPIPKWTCMEQGIYVAPRNSRETQLAELWSQLLGVDQPSIYDNFCELGGHSLLAIQLVHQVNEIFHIKLPLASFLEMPTIAGMAQNIESLCHADVAQLTNNEETEVELDSAIYPENILTEPIPEIFLTGATGTLGAYLLYELLQQTRADIYCLVRASSIEEVRAKIQNALKRYGLWSDRLSTRIIPVLGDLSQPYLGIKPEQFARLAEKIDLIYHCGAWVNVAYPYSALKAANVLGTQEILRLASQTKTKPVHFISTIDVFSATSSPTLRTIKEEDVAGPTTSLGNGYAQTKYMAEKLLMEAASRGLPISIYRPSNIVGDSKTGICLTDGFITLMLKGCLEMGVAPDIDAMLNLVPVDYVSQAIVLLSQKQEPCTQAFHLVNPEPIEWKQLIKWLNKMGHSIYLDSYTTWYSQLLKLAAQTSDNTITPLAGLFANQYLVQKLLGAFYFDSQETLNTFASNLTCPPVDDELLLNNFSHLLKYRGSLKSQLLTTHSGGLISV